MSTTAGSPSTPYRVRSTAADGYLSRHESRAPVRTYRCTLTVQAPPGQEIDDDAIATALTKVRLPKGYRVTETAVHRGWREAPR